MTKKKKKGGFWRMVKKIFLFIFLFQLFYIVLLRWVDPPITVTQLQSWFKGEGLRRDYVSASDISQHMKLAVIASEDQIFPDHGGFDWKNIKKATEYNKKKPGRLRGASTISQQTAKNVFLWQGRSWFRKGLEIYFTKMIEWIWGKKRILEVYLNVIEMGKGIYGVEAASQFYFNKPAEKLTAREASMISAALPNPKKYIVRPPSKYITSRSAWVQRQMRNLAGDPDIQQVIGVKSAKGNK